MSLNEEDAAVIAHEVVASIMRQVVETNDEVEEEHIAEEEHISEEEHIEAEEEHIEAEEEHDAVEHDEEHVEEEHVEEEHDEEEHVEEEHIEEEHEDGQDSGAGVGLTEEGVNDTETDVDAEAKETEAPDVKEAEAQAEAEAKPTFPPLTETWQTTLRYIMATSIFLLWLLACKRTWINNVDKLLCTWLLAMAVVLFQACLHKRADMLSVVHFGFLAYLLIAPFLVTSWVGRTLCTVLHALQYYVYFANGYRWPLAQWVPRHSKMMAWLKPFQGMYMDMVVASVRTMLLYVIWIGAGKRRV